MSRAIEWFARNAVAANLLMVLIVAGGIISLGGIKQEIFPEFSTDRITVTVEYLGATPAEVEEGVCVRVEEAIEGLEDIKRVRSTAREGVGVVTIEAQPGADVRDLLDRIKSRVDAIDTFPEETEQPVIQELIVRHQVINIAVSGDADERTLKSLGERVREEVSALPGITQVELINVRPYEISIEMSEDALRRHNLTFDDVAGAVRRSSLDLPGGSIKTSAGEILLRVKGQAYRRPDFEKLVLLTRPDGTRLLLGDVATVDDGFAETDQSARFDGDPSVMVQVYRVGDQSALEIADAVKRYVEDAKYRFPEGVSLTTWQDGSIYLRGRLDLLLRNALQGFALVFLILALFLRMRLAVWVSIGIPISFLGTLWLMPAFDVSINLLSLFAFILVLGIVVDDAIIVGESIYSEQVRGGSAMEKSIIGARQVATPVIFAVLTSIAAFSPMLSVSGQTGKFLRVISLIVIPTLFFSLVESLFILPAHLSHYSAGDRPKLKLLAAASDMQFRFARLVERFIERVYRPALERALEWRYLTAAVGVTMLLLTAGLVAGRWIRFTFFPSVEADNVAAMLTMPLGTPAETTERAIEKIRRAATDVEREIDGGEGSPRVFRHVLASVGSQPYLETQSRAAGNVLGGFSAAHLGEVHIELVPSEERTISSERIAELWREKTGPIQDAIELTFTSSIFSPGEAINVQLSTSDPDGGVEVLREAADRLKRHLATRPGVFPSDSFREGKREVVLDILPSAEAIGLTLSDLARQVRQGFYGEEAQRIQRGRDDIRVMVRYPADRRRSLGDLESMRIRTPAGDEVPFSEVARARFGRGYADIQRVDRRRTVNVTADVDEAIVDTNEIIAELQGTVLPELVRLHPTLRYSFEGQQREQAESLADLFRGFALALIVIYGLLAIPFHSYVQPMIVLLAVPFGLVGAAWGHVLMGLDLTILSVFGSVALTGVVINDSLVMVDFINVKRKEGLPLHRAVRDAGAVRFRPILLTSLTTFAGLTPLMLFERSVQAKFLVPMAVSLAYGVLFSTFVTLVLIPAGYVILEDFVRLGRKLIGRDPEQRVEEFEAVSPSPRP